MKTYKYKNILVLVALVLFIICGVAFIVFSRQFVLNIIGIILVLISAFGISKYIKYSFKLDNNELLISGICFRNKKIKYKNIVRIFTLNTGKNNISYIVDKYLKKEKWYIRGTNPPHSAEHMNNIKYSNLNEIVSINSSDYSDYKEILAELSKKVPINCDIDINTWHIIKFKD